MRWALTVSEMDLLIDALWRGAIRHYSLSRDLKPGGYFAARHEKKAVGMLELREKFKRIKAENKPIAVEVV